VFNGVKERRGIKNTIGLAGTGMLAAIQRSQRNSSGRLGRSTARGGEKTLRASVIALSSHWGGLPRVE